MHHFSLQLVVIFLHELVLICEIFQPLASTSWMFQSFIYLNERLFNFSANTYFISHSFFLSPLVFLTSVSLLSCYDF